MSHFNYRKFFRSFVYAFRGLRRLIQTEQNAKVHALAAVMVGILAVAFHLHAVEAAVLFFAVVLVFAIEITNTAIEKLLDLVHPESHSQIAYIKDALAGAVLIAVIIAVIVALLVFYPHIVAIVEKRS
ncbi:diacylglycerol kinase family protein [Patescibacteria group bacterium]|nr:diacylglycerol kinase family protein [Patescibacteria group bacterium]